MKKTQSAKALIVDDSAFMRKILKDILLANGFSHIYEAANGQEAVETFKKYKPDVVTMDFIMPGPDGLQVLKEILAIDESAKIVMVTTVGQDHVVKQAIELGATDYVVKPFESSKIIRVVEKVLTSR